MNRIKFFGSDTYIALEKEVNEFLAMLGNINVVEIRFQENSGRVHYTAMIWYKELDVNV